MKVVFWIFVSLISCITTASPGKHPRLVVGIVVDQMRYDYLNRFWDNWSNSGFKKLISKGFQYHNAHLNFMPTFTGPGHASIYTGTTPSVHGIIGNDWYDVRKKKMVYCTGDKSQKIVGEESNRGGMSPSRLLTTTITDELEFASHGRSRVFAVALKDRGAIFPAGHRGDNAFWYDDHTGHFITSSFYQNSLPEWVKAFNRSNWPGHFAERSWVLLLDPGKYHTPTNSKTPFRINFSKQISSGVPFKIFEKFKPVKAIKYSPFGNKLVKRFAVRALKEENLGQDSVTDFLSISFSSTDYAGHIFGVNSPGVEDMYLRLDRDIAELLDSLNRYVGKGNYLVFLTADHGAGPVSQELKENGVPAGYFDFEKLHKTLEKYLTGKYGKGDWIENFSNYQVYLNRELIEEKELKYNHLVREVVDHLLNVEGVANAITAHDLLTGQFGNTFLRNAQRGYHQKRSGDVMVILKPGWVDYIKFGSTHGSPYPYDTHIPLIWYGWRIPVGESVRYVPVTGIAPALSKLLNIPLPSGCSGADLPEVIQRK